MEWTQIFIPIVVSFAITVSVMPLFIGYFQMKKQGQVTREDGPTWHSVKTGTPTMGGVVFLVASLITSLAMGLFFHQFTPSLLIILFILVLYGLLGYLDDFIKVFKKRNMGLNSRQKLIGQIFGGLVFYFVSNAVNLTDGIDGLVAGLGTISFGTYAIIAWKQQQFDVVIICLSVIGGLIGFFPYNRKPAKIFMGDVGSLALGGLLAAISIILHQEWTLLLIGLVYVCETASVILQVASFKLFGRRIFKMSPIHHHFEMCGWSEWKIDFVFWSVGLICSGITLWILF